MTILYIIGNGLDIAHHMKTSYQDFFKYYLSQITVDGDIMVMKRDIDSHRYETWADLEIGMGVYASKCVNKGVFLKCLADIKKDLKEYLKKESEKIDLYKISSLSGFQNPREFLDPEPRIRYDDWRRSKSAGIVINVMTLNYTSTIEKLLGFSGAPLYYSDGIQLNSIHHIHGTLVDNMMVMGVNDTSQIANASISTDLDVVEEFVKPEYNDACMNNKNGIGESLIESADVIVIYGASLGLSDDKWWKLIGQKMQSNNPPLIVYLPYDENKDQTASPNHLRRWTFDYINEIRDKFGIQIDEKVLASRICIALNKRLFQITKVSQQNNKS